MTPDDRARRLAVAQGIELATDRHPSMGDGACLMEAVSYIAGERWSDAPQCASPVLAALLRTWNDVLPRGARQELKRYLPRLVGSRGTPGQERDRATRAVQWFAVHGPALPAGARGRRQVAASIESARLAARKETGTFSLPAPTRRVSRAALDAMHGLIDELLACTEAVPVQAAPPVPTDAPPPAPVPVPPAAPVQDTGQDTPAPAGAPVSVPARAPGQDRVHRPRRTGHRTPSRTGALPPFLAPVQPLEGVDR